MMHTSNNLSKGNFKRGFFWSFVLQFSSVGVQFLSTIILSRFLSPEDYGILAAISIFIAIGDMIVDSGMGGSLIKKDKVYEIDFSTLFVYNLFISLLIYAVIFFSAPLIGEFYSSYDGLEEIIRCLSVVIIIHALSIVQRIKLMKALRFRDLAIVTVLSNVLGLLVAIVIALYLKNVWALVFQQITTAIFLSVFCFIQNKYIPTFRFSMQSFKEQFKWGINLLLANTISTINDNIYSSIIAKISSPVFAGYYVQAVRMKNLPVNVMTQVVDKAVFPILSQCTDLKEFKSIVKKINRVVLLVVISVLLLIAYLSNSVILILLGEQWIEASWSLSILMYASIFICIQSLYRNILKSLGNTGRIFRNEIAKITISMLILLISAFGGFKMILLGIVLSNFLGAVWIMFSVKQCLNYSIREQFEDVFSVVGVCILAYILLILIFWTYDLSIIVDIVLKSICYLILLILLLFLFKLPECRYIRIRKNDD